MKKPHIAFLSESLNGGGAERVIVTLANIFSRSEYDVDIVLVKKEGSYLKEVDHRISIVDLSASRTLFAIPKLIKYFRENSPDSLLATQYHVNSLAIISKVLSGAKTKVCARIANTISPVLADSSFRQRALIRCALFLHKAADSIVAPSEGVAKDLLHHHGVRQSKMSIIPNPVDVQRIRDLAEDKVSAAIDMESEPTILAVGRLTSQKNYKLLIEAFAKIVTKQPAKLLILGEGGERKQLEQLTDTLGIAHKVFFLGFQENPFAYMSRATVYVLSSFYEGLPNTLIQALLVGAPVIATDCPSGPREILEGGKFGELIEVNNLNQMVTALEKGLRYQIKTPDHEKFRSKYDFAAVMKQYKEVLMS